MVVKVKSLESFISLSAIFLTTMTFVTRLFFDLREVFLFLLKVFLFVVFIFYPELGLVTATNEPSLYFFLPTLPVAEGFRRAAVSVFVLLAAFFYFLFKRRFDLRFIKNFGPSHLLLLLLGLTLFLSTFRIPIGIQEYGTVKFFSFTFMALIPSLLFLFFSDEEVRLERFVYLFVIAMILFFFLNYYWIITRGLDEILKEESIPYRFGAFVNPVWYGRWAGVAFLALSIFALFSKNQIQKLSAIIGLPFLLFLLLISGSRGPVVAVCGAIILLIFLKTRSLKQRVFFTSFVILSAVLAYQFTPPAILERLSSFEDLSQAYRIEGLKLAFELFLKNPIFGVGIGGYPLYSHYLIYPHNIIAEFAAETGILGLAPFLVFLILSLSNMVKLLKSELNLLTCFSTIIFFYLLLHSMFSLDIGNNYLLFFFGAFIEVLNRREKRRI